MKFPDKFLPHLISCPGFDQQQFIEAHELKPPVSLRLNADKIFEHHYKNKVLWSDHGYYLDERPPFVFDPLFHAGAYYVQEASGMFIEYILKQIPEITRQIKVLDLCAAPGGKSTIIASSITNESLLVSNEIIKTRISGLKENVTKWGKTNVVVTNNDPADFNNLPQFFDLILVDAPCSGSGLFRKDNSAIQEWSEESVIHCQKRQKRILKDILPSLITGGKLIYTTCSFSKEENEDIVEYLVNEFGMSVEQIDISSEWNIISTEFGHRFYPDKLKGEGFFACVLKKNIESAQVGAQISSSYMPYTAASTEEISVISNYIKYPEKYIFFIFKDSIFSIQKEFYNTIKKIATCLRVVQAGTEIGKLIREELIPAHAFAMSTLLLNTIATIELDESTAMQYLRKENIIIDTDKSGWVICTYKNIPLGWIKILPNRINNYYPVDWRIRK